ncbi:MAG TPA: DUF4956 domain-containing protein, partial [Gaiellaceae bacterium]|nr:DUF4956 domain-containing protein [Gaiellaceae bacterium]
MTLVLDEVRTDDVSLRAELERRLGFTVVETTVVGVDYVRETMTVDVRYVPAPAREGEAAVEAPVLRVRR